MLDGIDERRILQTHSVEIRFFPEDHIKDTYHYLMPILEKKTEYLILHVKTNDAVDSFHQKIVNDLLALNWLIREKLQNCNIILSMSTKRCANQKASATVNLVNKQLSEQNIEII